MAKPKRGLELLVSGAPVNLTQRDPNAQEVLEIELDAIVPNPFQPRTRFTEDDLLELTDSIREQGVLTPIIVRQIEDGFEIIVGERRWRASKAAGKKTIPAIVRTASDRESFELALIENIQRKDLNPVETARAYRNMQETFKLTHDEIAKRIGVSRAAVTNALRLLKLPEPVLELLEENDISVGHAKILTGLDDPAQIHTLSLKIKSEQLSVRELEDLLSRTGKSGKSRRKSGASVTRPAHIRELEEKLRVYFGTKVTIQEGRNRGRIIIDFYSNDDFERILDLMKVSLGP